MSQQQSSQLSSQGMVLLRGIESIATDPDAMMPLDVNAGEYIHLGYEHVNEEEAFEMAKLNYMKPTPLYEIGWSAVKDFIRFPRGRFSAERLAQLCYKFICLNHGIDIIVPKRRFMNELPRKSLFSSKINYEMNSKEEARIQLEILAKYRKEEEREVEEIIVNVHRLRGSVPAHYKLLDCLQSYLESDGNGDPIIARHPIPSSHYTQYYR